jgi:hypothetical protein
VNNFFINESFAGHRLDDSDLLVFFHAQRTGGSAFRHILADAYGKDRIYCTQYVDGFKHWPEVNADALKQKMVFAGHSNYELRDISKNQHMISILRHPVYRTFSLYYYCKKYPNQFLHDYAINSTIEGFYYAAVKRKPIYFNNVMCRRISGSPSFEKAIVSINERFIAIGCTETFSDFAGWFLRSQGLDAQEIKSADSDFKRYGELLDKEQLVNDILAANSEDEKLFRYFNERYFNNDKNMYPWSDA